MMKRIFFTGCILACALFLFPEMGKAATSRSCTLAAKYAKKLQREVYLAKREASYSKRLSLQHKRVHATARSSQRSIVQKFASHFKKNRLYSKWLNYKLKRRLLSNSKLRKFSRDLKKLRKGGYNLDQLKKANYKFKPRASLGLPAMEMAPCLKLPKAISKSIRKSINKLKRAYSKNRLQKMYKTKTFLLSLRTLSLKASITKTKTAIALAKRLRPYARRLTSRKRRIKSYLRSLRRYKRQCQRTRRSKTRRRTSLDQNPSYRRCGVSQEASETTQPQAACYTCQWDSYESDAANSLSGSTLDAGFEINFLTAQYQTDEAYYSSASDADFYSGGF